LAWEALLGNAGSRLVLEPEAVSLLSKYSVPYPEHRLARSVEEAVRLAAELGYPVVLKVVSPDVVHKSDAGGVVTDIEDPGEVREAYAEIIQAVKAGVPRARIDGILVCKQAPEGFEVIVGGLDDPAFGPAVMFGLGGVRTEVHEDVVFRVAPLEATDAEDMIREIDAYSLMVDAAGQPRYDLQAIVELLLSVSRLLTEHPEIKELDLNPVRLCESGLIVLDARMMVEEQA
jgi:acyl-CoA synthetase (NDP forming)